MGVLFTYQKRKKIARFMNNYTGEVKFGIEPVDKIADIVLTHAKIDNVLLFIISEYFQRGSEYGSVLRDFFKEDISKGKLQKAKKDLYTKAQTKHFNIAHILEPYLQRSSSVWEFFWYYMLFDHDGQFKFLIEYNLDLDYFRKIELLEVLHEWEEGDVVPTILKKMGAERGKIEYSNFLGIKYIPKRTQIENPRVRFYLQNILSMDGGNDIHATYELYEGKYRSLIKRSKKFKELLQNKDYTR